MSLLLLIAAGAAGGFLVGLVGVGGGVVYVPVLLVYFAGLGVRDPVLAPLVVGSSLLCVGLASASGAYGQWRAGAVRGRVAVVTGLVAGVALTAVSLLVTTRPWYDRTVFQAVFGAILLGVAAQMLRRSRTDEGGAAEAARPGAGALALAGASAGALAAVAGVGGGVVLVPLYHGLLGFPTKVATATSTAAIALIAAVGVVAYAVLGQGADVPAGAVGYVDVGHALALAVPAMLTARLGVWVAHRIAARWVRRAFALVAAATALRLLWGALA
ncbi:MAG TPA: sulfite exporter TauE/SafE family protein [Rubricoccaceae bacterium]|nr:sulfite exporter TauE/SafE family protein [Rubricoccaceae bacterium]